MLHSSICSGHNEGRGISSELCFLPRLIHACLGSVDTERQSTFHFGDVFWSRCQKGQNTDRAGLSSRARMQEELFFINRF
jgi:hypothetical protein